MSYTIWQGYILHDQKAEEEPVKEANHNYLFTNVQ